MNWATRQKRYYSAMGTEMVQYGSEAARWLLPLARDIANDIYHGEGPWHDLYRRGSTFAERGLERWKVGMHNRGWKGFEGSDLSMPKSNGRRPLTRLTRSRPTRSRQSYTRRVPTSFGRYKRRRRRANNSRKKRRPKVWVTAR